ncbi:MAG: DUF5131 family protein [Planctomycetota bacterium]|jgi:protein gp37
MGQSKIEWTDVTWNPVTGCSKVSAGCKNCYAERLAKRLKAMGQIKYAKGFEVTLHQSSLGVPSRWQKPRRVFVCSMGDLFHEAVPTSFIKEVFRSMSRPNRHTYQILTKRADRLGRLSEELPWDYIWMGVSVEGEEQLHRVEALRKVPAKVRFLSLEPLLEPLPSLDLTGIDWVIVGGESGPRARPMEGAWGVDIRDKCQAAGVPFFFKQWGGTNKKKAGRLLDGRTWDERPGRLKQWQQTSFL